MLTHDSPSGPRADHKGRGSSFLRFDAFASTALVRSRRRALMQEKAQIREAPARIGGQAVWKGCRAASAGDARRGAAETLSAHHETAPDSNAGPCGAWTCSAAATPRRGVLKSGEGLPSSAQRLLRPTRQRVHVERCSAGMNDAAEELKRAHLPSRPLWRMGRQRLLRAGCCCLRAFRFARAPVAWAARRTVAGPRGTRSTAVRTASADGSTGSI
jgi:hypothetical protein